MQLRAGVSVMIALLAAASSAEARPEDDPPTAWEARTAPPTPTLEPEEVGPPPLDLTESVSPLDARLADLAARQRWLELADLLARVSDGTVAEGSVLRTDHPGQPLLGAREDVRRRFGRLPPQALEAYRALVDQRADLLLREGRLADAPLSDLLERYGATRAAAAAARALGERMLERGDLDGAALLWRRALADQGSGDPDLETRLVALRSLLGVDRPGSLTPRLPDPPARWTIAWARRALGGDPKLPRPVAADGTHVYLTDHRGVIALKREDGGLAWRIPLRGDPREQRLALGAAQLLLVRRDRLVAIDCERGTIAWEHLLDAGDLPARPVGGSGAEDRFHDAVATPSGFAALATHEGQFALIGVSRSGQPLFETHLWSDRDEEVNRPVFPRWVLAAKGSRDPDGNERTEDRMVAVADYKDEAPPRWVVGDGRLATIGDRVVLTIGGVVAACSAAHGGVLWLRDNSFGVQVAGERNVLVQLAVGPFAAEAVTAAGNLVRLDPLDGASLAIPLPPEGLYQEAGARPYVLNLSPLVLGWDPADRGGFHISAGLPARPVVRFAQGPLGPGALSGSTLALPDPEGVVLVDLVHGKELLDEPLPWTLGAAPVVVAGGLLVAAGPEGLVVLTPRGADEVKPPTVNPDASLATWIDLLSHPDWRARLRAQDQLASLDAGPGDVALLERAARDAPTLDARDVARDLVEQARRRRLFADLAGPAVRASLVRDLARGVNLVERLRELRDLVPPGDRTQEELRRQVVEAEEPAVRHALLEVLLKVDGRARERLGAALRDPAQPDAVRAGCARVLVAAVLAGAPAEPLRRALAGDAPEENWAWVMEAVRGHPDPERLLEVLPELQRTFARPPAARDVTPAAAMEALLEAAPRLFP